jgi:Dolichyl-phosphate-mannose-protein mannosyltransferase
VIWYAIAHFPHNWFFSRGIELGTLGQSLAAGHGLSSPFGASTGPTALLAPGYPALIALVFRVFGPFTVSAALAVMAMQLLFNLTTVWLVMRIARDHFGTRAANLSGTFWAISLPLIWMPTIFWETCFSTLLLVGAVALALHGEQTASLTQCVGIGAYCGLTTLVNPALLFSLVAILGWIAWKTNKPRWQFPLSLLALCLVFAPWPARNALALHALIPLRSTVGFELWIGNRRGASGFLDESLFPLFNQKEHDEYVRKGEVAYMRDKAELARAYIGAHSGEFLRLSGLRFLRFWTGTGNRDGSVFYAMHAVLTTCLGFLGFGRLAKQGRLRLALLFLLPLVVFPLPYYITHAEFRYRLVVDPLLTILAGDVASGFCERVKL